MGYNIYIGNAEPQATEDDFEWVVKSIRLGEAPSFPGDEPTLNSNTRFPSYTTWANILRAADLHELFYGEYEGLMKPHPGIRRIKLEHVEEVEHKVRAWQAKHPKAVPRFWDDVPDSQATTQMDEDATLARLEWLAWWMRWAIENCQHPAIYNS